MAGVETAEGGIVGRDQDGALCVREDVTGLGGTGSAEALGSIGKPLNPGLAFVGRGWLTGARRVR